MEEIYIKEKKIFDLTSKEQDEELLSSIMEAKKNLEIAHKNFEFADNELVDYYSYQIKANSSKLDYLTRIAKSKGIVMDAITRDENKL